MSSLPRTIDNLSLILTHIYGGFLNLQGKCLNLKEQVDLFEKTVKSDLSGLFKNPNDLADYLSKSIFLVSVGSNDFINNYLQPTLYDTSKRYPPPQFAQLLMNALSHQFEVYLLSI